MNLRVLRIAGLVALWAVGLYGFVVLRAPLTMTLVLPAAGSLGFAIIEYALAAQARGNFATNLPFEIDPERLDEAIAISSRYNAIAGAEMMIGFTFIQVGLNAAFLSRGPGAPFVAALVAFVIAILATVYAMMVQLWSLRR